MELVVIISMFSLAAITFAVAFALTPLLLRFLHQYKFGKQIRDAASAPVMAALHQAKAGTPTMGGILIWGTVALVMVFFHYAAVIFGGPVFTALDFYSRPQTLLPFGALIASAVVGLVDDYYNIRRLGPKGGGLRMRHRLLLYMLIATVGAWWFSTKLEWDILRIPFVGDFNIGWWCILFFIFVIVATSFSVNETDGLDGLAGGALLSAFGAYAIIAFVQGKFDLAVFCSAIVGALLAFLWFNINPASFFMGDTGSMPLGVTLAIVALLTNTALLLPVIGLVFVLESASVLIQVFSKKFFKRKVFRSAPVHHHLEAIGWPEPKIVMRAWIIAWVAAAAGVILVMIDFGFFR